jgi:hypothetical protein
MRTFFLIAGIGMASLALGGCTVDSRSSANDQAADSGGRDGPSEESNASGIHVDLGGVRADVDANGTDVRIDRDGVAVNLDGRDVEAKVRTGEDPSVSVTTNRH